MASQIEAKKLCVMGFRFRGHTKVVKKYWEARWGSVCLIWFEIGHDLLGGSGWKKTKCVIFTRDHKMEDHKFCINECQTGVAKICTHILAKCVNCGGKHQAISLPVQIDKKQSRKLEKKRWDEMR